MPNILLKVKGLLRTLVVRELKGFQTLCGPLIAACYFVGLSVWVSAKVWGAIFGIATLPFVFGVVHRAGVPKKLAMLAPLLLVASPNLSFGVVLAWRTLSMDSCWRWGCGAF